MRRGLALLTLGVLLIAATSACNRDEEIPPDVISTVGPRMITTAAFDRYLERNPGVDLAQIAPEAASALLDQHLEEILLSEYAATRGI